MAESYKGQMLSEFGDTISGIRVTELLPTGHAYLVNEETSMFKHLEALLQLFLQKKPSLTPMKKEDMVLENFYLIDDPKWGLMRVQMRVPNNPNYTLDGNGVLVEYSDWGGSSPELVPYSDLYLSSDVDIVLNYLPLQCVEVKLTDVPNIPLAQIPLAKTLFPCNQLFSVTLTNLKKENGHDVLCVEIFNCDDILDPLVEKSVLSNEYGKISINAEIIKLISNDKKVLPSSFRPLEIKIPDILWGIKWLNSKWAVGKRFDIFVDSVYTHRDFCLISHDNLKVRREIEEYLLYYTTLSVSQKLERDSWTRVGEHFVLTNPNAMYVVPLQSHPQIKARGIVVANKNGKKTWRDREDDDKEFLWNPLFTRLFLIDYGKFKICQLKEIELLTSPKYCKISPLVVTATLNNGRAWERKYKKSVKNFNEIEGKTIRIQVMEHLDEQIRMCVSVKIVDMKVPVDSTVNLVND